MPELPDITVYVERLQALAGGARLRRLRIAHPFVLRTALPTPAAFEGCRLAAVERLGKRVVLAFETADGERFAVVHLMIAGRLHWRAAGAKAAAPGLLAAFEFDTGTLALTEAGRMRRASLHLLAGREALRRMDPGGIDPLGCSGDDFAHRLALENHTLKRALTDPRLFSGIGNAYSDEILHRARLSPLTLTRSLPADAVARLFEATRSVLADWTARLREAAAGGWPDKVTAFHPQMAVHGRHGQPCPDCGSPVQRIVYTSNECNYCAHCQTGGRLLADRALSRLLHDSWPKHLDEAG